MLDAVAAVLVLAVVALVWRLLYWIVERRLSTRPWVRVHRRGVPRARNGDPYTLQELREYIPRGWRRPALARTDVGRNCDVFRSLMRFAGVADHSDLDVARLADQIYQDIAAR